MLFFSILQALLIISLLAIKLTGHEAVPYDYLLISACGCALILFVLGYPIFRRLVRVLKARRSSGGIAGCHFLLHIIILAFIVLDQLHGLSHEAMLAFSPWMILFFLTAAVTWHSCHSVFKSKIYRFFTLGSTALLLWSTVLALLGLFYRESFLSEKLRFLLLGYFALHFTEFGFVLLKIRSDLKSIR